MEPTSITACLKPGEKKAFILTANEKEIVVDFQEKYLAGRTLDGHHEYQEKRYILIFDNPKSKKRTSLTAKRISLTVTELLKAIAVEKDTIKGICSIYVDHANYLH
jgi:hypothetical protein